MLNKIAFTLLLLLVSIAVGAAPPVARDLALDQISLERINIQSHVQTWRLRKICIDNQAYLVLLQGVTEVPVSLSASYLEGKPEQCHIDSSNNPVTQGE